RRRWTVRLRLTRRSLLCCAAGAGMGLAAHATLGRGAGAWAATASSAGAPPASGPSSAETVELLREFILQRALSSSDPWVQAHVVLALGADVEYERKPVLDAMVAQSLRTEAVDLKQYPFFPTEVERHPFHFVQIMQATEVPYERAFVTPRGRFTRREIVSGSEALFDPAAVTDELSWVVSVLTHEHPQDRDGFETARGLEVHVTKLVERHLTETEAAWADTFAAMAGAKGYTKGAVHRTACNGTHMIYGLIDALRYGYTVADLRARTGRLVGALLFRMRAEPALIDASLRTGHPLIRLNADAAKLTFLGHAVEDLGYGAQHGVLKLTPPQLEVVSEARAQLATIVARVTAEHDVDALQSQVPQAYKILLGDACHAYRGLRFWS
ncbi:MAG: hypothetical protein AB1689_00320, partial [Thermodesulfobacteriota bacterium]